jgi:hypothetical protein
MTIVVQILDGCRYTLWNVTQVYFTEKGVSVEHSDRPNTEILGRIRSITRRDS